MCGSSKLQEVNGHFWRGLVGGTTVLC